MMLVRIKPERRDFLVEDLRSAMELEGALPRAVVEISYELITILPISGPRKVGDLLITMRPYSPVTFQVSGVGRELVRYFEEIGFERVERGVYRMEVDRMDAPVLLEILMELTALLDLGAKWMMNRWRFRRYRGREGGEGG